MAKNQTVVQSDKQWQNTQQQTTQNEKTQSQSQSTQQQQSSQVTQNLLNSELLAQILGGLQNAGYTQKTSEELAKIAQDAYLPIYNAEIEAAKQAQAAKDLTYAQQLETLAGAYGKNVDAQNAAFDQSRARIETGALARGMGRSSYTLSTLNQNDMARSAALAQLADDYSRDVRQVSDQRTQAAAHSAETLGRLEADKATNIANQLTQLAEREYEKYITGVNTQNSNYLAAVQAAMGQQTTGQQTSVGQQTTTGQSSMTGSTNTQAQSGGESVQVTKVGGSGSGGSGGSGSTSAATGSVYRADYLMGSGTSAAASNKGRKG